jgi:hypothetical protein
MIIKVPPSGWLSKRVTRVVKGRSIVVTTLSGNIAGRRKTWD